MRNVILCLVALTMGCGKGLIGDLPPALAPTQPVSPIPVTESLSPVGETGLVGTVGSSATLTVRALVAGGVPARNAYVIFQVISGGGSTTPVPAYTDAQGYASAVWTFGSTPGTNVVKVLCGSVSPVQYTATVGPAASREP